MNLKFTKFSALLIIAIMLVQLTSNAQMIYKNVTKGITKRTCGTTALLEKQKLSDPGLEQRMANIEKQTQKWIKNHSNMKKTGVVITIPVVVHVIWNTSVQNISNAQIFSQITVLNQDFRRLNPDTSNTPAAFQSVAADVEVEFCLVTEDPLGNPTTGITRTQTSNPAIFDGNDWYQTSMGGKDIWDRDYYMNIYVGMGASLGFAYLPGAGAAWDAIFIRYDAMGSIDYDDGSFILLASYDKGRTATHEAGHWLNLKHPFDGGCVGTDASTCSTQGDNCCDTPPTVSANYGCPGVQNTCIETPVDQNDMTMNFVDYVDDACMNLFTYDQKARVLAVLGGIRSSLTTSQACQPDTITVLGENCATAIQIISPGTYIADGPATGGGATDNTNATNADWYYFTATMDDSVEISTCNDPGVIDSRLWIWNGSCGMLTPVTNNDDYCNTSGFSSYVKFPVTTGTTYYIEWDDKWSSSGFEFEINFIGGGAAGETCVTAIQITSPGTYIADGPATGGGATDNTNATNADWYYFTATMDDSVEISTCNDPGDVDSRLWIWSGSCGALIPVTNNDDYCNTSGYSSYVTFPVTNGTTYYIEWDDKWDTSGFVFEFNFIGGGSSCNADFWEFVDDPTLTVDFFDASFNAANWWWDFDDGGWDTIQNPVHTYASPGLYEVWLYIEDGMTCYDSISYFILVGDTAGGGADCWADFWWMADSSLSVQFVDDSYNATQWEWDFGDGSPLDFSQNPAHTYTIAGTYIVCLDIVDSTGCTDFWCYSVTVPAINCEAGFYYITDATLTVQFFDTSLNAGDWYWDYGDGTFDAEIDITTHTYPFPGIYDVCLYMADSTYNCFDEMCITIEVPLGGDHCTNGVQDADEIDVDCGGVDCMPCGGLIGGCDNDNILLISYPAPASIGDTIYNSCVQAGEYVRISNMIADNIYLISTCGSSFDTEITIYKSGDSTAVDYNDDACGTQSELYFVPSFNGNYDILIDEYSCANSGTCAELWIELVGTPGSGCEYDNDLWFSVPAPTNPSDTFFESCIHGGEYITITNMIAGNTYYIATCGNTNFDSEITIYLTGGGIPVAYNDDSCGSQAALMFTPSVSGDYDILVNEHPCGYNPVCMNLLVALEGVGVGGCVADFDFDTDTTLTVLFYNFAVSDNALTYAWDFGDAGTSSVSDPSYTYGSFGAYEVCLTVDDGFGCTDTYCDSVTITNVVSTCSYAQPEICVVTVDSATQKNQIVWEKEVTTDIASYNIYREGLANQYSLVGNVLYADLSNFLDITSTPAQQQYTYKISAMDNCGDESPMSSSHSTLHLIMLNDALGETKINFVWSNYKGVPVLGYYVWRYSTTLSNTLLSTIANTMSTFSDMSPPATGDLGYTWILALTSVCDATASTSKKTLTYNSAKSNISNRQSAVGISAASFENNAELNIFPNPYSDETKITYNLGDKSDVSLEVYNLLGKKVHTLVNESQNAGQYQLTFTSDNSGVYILKLQVNDKVYIKRLLEY